MLREGIPIGRLFGISIRLHYSWFIIFALVTWALTTSYFPVVHPHWSTTTAVVTGLITSLLFFASLLAHELMHSIVAQRSGIPVKAITLFVFGGVSQISEEPRQASVEFKVAIAGPLTSIILGGIFWAIWFLVPSRIETLNAVSFWLGWINLSLAAFNLIPGFPLDGGRVLRSIIWWRTKNLRRATRFSSNVGKVVGLLFIFGGIWYVFAGSWFNGLWLALIGWFLTNAAAQSYRQMVMQLALQGYAASDIMHHECLMIPPDITIEKLVNEHLLPLGRRCFLVAIDGKVQGLVTLQDIKAVLRAEWPTKQVSQIMKPIEKLKWVRPDEDLGTVMRVLTEEDINQLPVMQEGNIVGMVARDNLLNFINVRNNLGI
jgi:Zn-dependent protease/predicted transcriptional regulator